MNGLAAVEACSLTKDFTIGVGGARLRAIDRLNLRVRTGTTCGFLGPNGSGKSTTIKLLLGLLTPTAGSCSLLGVPCGRFEARLRVGYAPESPAFHRHLTGLELIRCYGELCGLTGAALANRTADVIAKVGLARAARQLVATYSKGMLQRLGIAQAVVHDPPLIILDEPTAGLDPAGVADVCNLVRALKDEGRTVIISSHLPDGIHELCDQIVILHRGRLIFESSLPDASGAEQASVHVGGLPTLAAATIARWASSQGGTATFRRERWPALPAIYEREVARADCN